MFFIHNVTGQAQAERANWWRRAAHTVSTTVSTVTAPVIAAGSAAVTTVGAWWRPIPLATETDKAKWRRQKDIFAPFIENDPIELFNLFEDETWRSQITDNQVFCALHHPGLALDLIILYDIKSKHNQYVISSYGDWGGSSRDRLYETLCTAMKREVYPARDTNYETFIYNSITHKTNCHLYKALNDHRYVLSPSAIIGKPDTLSKLTANLRERRVQAIRRARRPG